MTFNLAELSTSQLLPYLNSLLDDFLPNWILYWMIFNTL